MVKAGDVVRYRLPLECGKTARPRWRPATVLGVLQEGPRALPRLRLAVQLKQADLRQEATRALADLGELEGLELRVADYVPAGDFACCWRPAPHA